MRDHTTVNLRKVFYIPGFDPFPPRRYRELYRTESQKQAGISGYSITQSPLMGAERFGWQVVGDIDGAVCTTDIEVLGWSDIVKSSMSDGIAATYAQMIRTAWIDISTRTLFDIVKLRKGPVIAALYPVGFWSCRLCLHCYVRMVHFMCFRLWRVSLPIISCRITHILHNIMVPILMNCVTDGSVWNDHRVRHARQAVG